MGFDLYLTDDEAVEILNALTDRIIKHLCEKKGADGEDRNALQRKIEFLSQIKKKIKDAV